MPRLKYFLRASSQILMHRVDSYLDTELAPGEAV